MNKFIKLYAFYLIVGAFVLATVYMTGVLHSKPRKINTYNPTIRSILAVTNQECLTDDDCNNGECELVEDTFGKTDNSTKCVCDDGYISLDGEFCDYEQRNQLVAFLLSFFLGEFCTDWFYLSRGVGIYIFAGVCKCLTCGCCGIWWCVDWIRILTNGFPDGLGQELLNNM